MANKYIKYFPAIPALLAFLFYANTINHDFTQDDAIVIYDNMFVKDGVKGINGLLNKDTFYGFFKKEGKDKLVSGGRYRPLTPIMFAIGWELFGNNPKPYHIINIFWYALLGIILYFLILELLSHKMSYEDSAIIALMSSIIFISHPVHTEAVANIKGRDEIMSLLLSISALFFYIKYLYSNSKVKIIIASLLFFLGLMAKENTITFIAIMPLAAYFFTDKKPKVYLLSLLPVISVTILYLWKRADVLGNSLLGGKPPLELMNNPFVKIVGNKYEYFTLSEKLSTITYTLGDYIRLLFYPKTLTHDYYPRHIELMSWSDFSVIISLLFYLIITALAIWALGRRKIWSFGILYYLITLSIVSNIVFPVGTNMSERFIFMPSIGFSLFISCIIYLLVNKYMKSSFIKMTLLSGLIVLAFGFRTINRNKDWKDNYTLFTTDVLVSKNSAKLNNSAGGVLIDKAYKLKDQKKKEELLTKANTYLRKAIEIHPNYKGAYLLLGNSYFYLGNFNESIKYYNQGLRFAPNDEDILGNLAVAYREGGKYLGEKMGDIDNAIKYLDKSYALNSNDYETLRLLGVANGNKGNHENAIKYFTEASQRFPDIAMAWYNLGIAYMLSGNTELGQKNIDKAKKMDPEVGKSK